MPNSPNSSAQLRVNATSAALVPEYTVRAFLPWIDREDMFTTRPKRCAFISGAKACMKITAERRCRFTPWSKASSVTSSSIPGVGNPALFTSTLTLKRAAMSEAALRVAAASVRSACTKW